LLAGDLVPFHEIGEDVNLMVTSTDTHGPAILVDSSIYLMTHLLHMRITEVPGASLNASQDVVRWLFRKWIPGEVLP
jgi:ataxia telangiectasia mutated family protein